MIDVIIAFLIVAIVFFRLRPAGKRVLENAYKWWFVPWAGILYVLVIYALYQTLPLSAWPFFSLFVQDYQLEAVVSLFGMLVWMLAVLPFLKTEARFKSFTSLYRRLFVGAGSDKQKALPFPYRIDSEGAVKGRVGQVFCRRVVKVAAIVLALVYALYFLSLYIFDIKFYLISSFGLLGLIPILDYYVYLSAEVLTEEVDVAGNKIDDEADFEKLWKTYVELFDNYSVAWMRTKMDRKEIERKQENNSEEVSDLISSFEGNHMDAVLEDCNLVDAFLKMEPLFDWAEKNGKFALVALDIPRHFSGKHQSDYVEEIVENLKVLLRKEFLVYGENTPRAALSSSVVVAPLSLLSRQELDREWLAGLGLVTVVNLFDRGVSNLSECRKFCFLLQSVNKDYQFLFINPYRRGTEPSLRNTWVTRNQITEKKLTQYLRASGQFYIGYDFEDYGDRSRKILASMPSEPLYSGLELAPIALSAEISGEGKPITPVHFLDLAYTNIIEGKEELGKFRSQLNDALLKVSAADINNNMVTHLLPLERMQQNSIFSIIFDQDNNAPAAYNKWTHLGTKDNFSILVSRPYLFRDYFNANLGRFIAAPMVALQPHLCKSRITLAIILLDILRKARVEETQLRDLIRYYYDEKDVKSVSGIIRQLFSTYFSSSIANCLQTAFSITFEKGQYRHNTLYWLDVKDDVALSYLDEVCVRDESGNTLFEILRDLLFQNYEAGQIHSFSGKPYVITEYDAGNRTLKVSASNNTEDDIAFYRPVLEVSLAGERALIKEMESRYEWTHPQAGRKIALSFEGFETGVSVKTREWFTFHRYSVVGADSFTTRSNGPERAYPRGKVLKVSLDFILKQEYLDRIDDIRRGLQILLYEAMWSVFPQHAQYLIIASQGRGYDDLPWIFNSFNCDDQPEDGRLSFYFIEDAHIDLGLIGSLASRDNFGGKYLFRHIHDYLQWLKEGESVPAGEGYKSYLTKKNLDRYSFLKYGRETLPDFFDVDILIDFIRDFFCDGDQAVIAS